MKTVKTIIATMPIGHKVELYSVHHEGEYSPEFIVTYGQMVHNFSDIRQAWNEYNSCCVHCLTCESYFDHEED